jgi:outer membrane protein, heavy metal efflux system
MGLLCFRISSLSAMVLLLAAAAAGRSKTLITLEEAIDLALAHNHSLKGTRTRVLQNQAQEVTANLRPNPVLGGDSQLVPCSAPGPFRDKSGSNAAI